jgi:hypothetical protein
MGRDIELLSLSGMEEGLWLALPASGSASSIQPHHKTFSLGNPLSRTHEAVNLPQRALSGRMKYF